MFHFEYTFVRSDIEARKNYSFYSEWKCTLNHCSVQIFFWQKKIANLIYSHDNDLCMYRVLCANDIHINTFCVIIVEAPLTKCHTFYANTLSLTLSRSFTFFVSTPNSRLRSWLTWYHFINMFASKRYTIFCEDNVIKM